MKTNTSVKSLAAGILSAYNQGAYLHMVDLTSRLLVATNWDNRACNINDAAFGLAYPTRFVNTERCHSMVKWTNYFINA